MGRKTDRQKLELKRKKQAAKAEAEKIAIEKAHSSMQSAESAKLEYDACIDAFESKLEDLESLGAMMMEAKKLSTRIRNDMKKVRDRGNAEKIIGAHEARIASLENEIEGLSTVIKGLEGELSVAKDSAHNRHQENIELRARLASPPPPAWIRNLVKNFFVEDAEGNATGVREGKDLAKFFRRLHRWTKGSDVPVEGDDE